MAKQEPNLDDLNFLEDNEFNVDKNYLLFQRLYSLNKIKLTVIILMIGIILLTVIYYVKKPLYNNMETNLAAPVPSIISSQAINANIQEPSYVVKFNQITEEQYSNTENALFVGSQQQQNTITTKYYNKESINELITFMEIITNLLIFMNNKTKELQQNLQEILHTTLNIKNKVSNIDLRISNLTKNVDDLSVNIKKYIDEELNLATYIQPITPNLFSDTSRYIIHAVIPGRAWLKSESGQIITVAEGDFLGDYGKIIEINLANYFVKTSSGVIIR